MLRGIFIVVFLLTPVMIAGQELVESGTFKRKFGIFGTTLYEARLYTPKDQRLIDDFKAYQQLAGTSDLELIDQLGLFLLETDNAIALTLEIELLFKSSVVEFFMDLFGDSIYERERQQYIDTFKRGGFDLTQDLKLISRNNYQPDIDSYFKMALGLTEEAEDNLRTRRKKHDIVRLQILENGKAIFFYNYRDDGQTKEVKEVFDDQEVIRAVLLTYITKMYCSDELKNKLPKALLSGLLQGIKQ